MCRRCRIDGAGGLDDRPHTGIAQNIRNGASVFIKKNFVPFRCFRILAATVAALGMLACSPPEPVRLGFVGGLSGRVADLGVEGRNGAALAVEMRNKAGGVKGRPVELLAEDDQQNPEVARQAVSRLIDLKADAIIGPMTSAMALAVIPLVNQAQRVLIAPTVSTRDLSGIDDYFFRVVASTDVHARSNAEYHYNRVGLRRVAAVYDLNNKSYTESWLDEYRQAFVALGGEVVDSVTFSSGADVLFPELARDLLRTRPDGVLIIANSVDAAMLCQHLRQLDPSVLLTASEWAATEQLIELGGRSVEGIVIAQLLDRQSVQKPYLDFRRDYTERFGKVPGFPGLTAFDATNAALDAIGRQAPGQTLKQVLLSGKAFPGVQDPVVFDAYGDTSRPTYLTTVKDGAFVRLP